jgi:hypothetical protein
MSENSFPLHERTMTDIVKRLRNDGNSWAQELFNEAADEIERLCVLKTPASRALLYITKAALEAAEAEVVLLRAALLDARNALHNDSEPDNQSTAYKRADAALRSTEDAER